MRNFKKAFSDGHLYFVTGLLLTTICIPSDNIYVNAIIVPIGFILLILSAVIMIKNYKRDKEPNQNYESQDKHSADNHSKLRLSLLSLISSLFGIVPSIVLLLLFTVEKLNFWRYYLAGMGCFQIIILIISIVAFIKQVKK